MQAFIKKYLSGEPGIALLFGVLAVVLYPIWVILLCPRPPGLLPTGLLITAASCATSLGLYGLRHLYIGSLITSIQRDADQSRGVEVNGVQVGAISKADYSVVRLRVWKDVNVYAAQLANFVVFELRVVSQFMMSVPVFLFWIAVGAIVFQPESVGPVIADLQTAFHANQATFVQGLRQGVANIAAPLLTLFAMLNMFGMASRFAEETKDLIRQRLGVPAEGEMRMVLCPDHDGRIPMKRTFRVGL